MSHQVIVVGAGLAGLACARRLRESGYGVLLLEAADAVGGRVRTDVVDGFRLDRGFQVHLTAYPEAQRLLDYRALRLRPFRSGALIRVAGALHPAADPFREPLAGVRTALSPIGTLGDKLRIPRLRARLGRVPLRTLFDGPEEPIESYLRGCGFSDVLIDRFFRPFFGGILLDRGLQTSARLFRYIFRMLADGETVVPELGMQQIPAQLAAHLPAGCVRLGSPVQAVAPRRVELATGQTLRAEAVVLATDVSSAHRLRGQRGTDPGWRSQSCFYFAAPEPPPTERWLVLNGEGPGPVNNLALNSAVSPAYAPPGRALVSAVVVGPEARRGDELLPAVRRQVREWFGSRAERWEHLRTYTVTEAQPRSAVSATGTWPNEDPDGLIRCGDYLATTSIQGALESGRLAAEAVERRLG